MATALRTSTAHRKCMKKLRIMAMNMQGSNVFFYIATLEKIAYLQSDSIMGLHRWSMCYPGNHEANTPWGLLPAGCHQNIDDEWLVVSIPAGQQSKGRVEEGRERTELRERWKVSRWIRPRSEEGMVAEAADKSYPPFWSYRVWHRSPTFCAS